MTLKIVEYSVAFLEESKRASGLPRASSWEDAKVSDKRCDALAQCKVGTGHDKFLSGICVFVVFTANHAFLLQFMEYHFVHRVSSTSKMHTFPQAKEEDIEALPIGFELTQAHVINYRQLKTMYKQRLTHRLESWRVFCSWIETLPESHLITGVIHDNAGKTS